MALTRRTYDMAVSYIFLAGPVHVQREGGRLLRPRRQDQAQANQDYQVRL